MSYPVSAKAAAVPQTQYARSKPVSIDSVVLGEGTLKEWQELNAAATIPHCIENMTTSGVIDNFRRVVDESGEDFRGLFFADSDLYKVVEAAAWEIARSGTHEFDEWLDETIALTGRVQEDSGYLDTWIQGVNPESKFRELELTHEMYILGHMIQAAIALDRANGNSELLNQARKHADLIDRRFGPGREDGICGHPEIETALIELYRHTGEVRYLKLAEKMIDLRGHRTLPLIFDFDHQYFQDHEPVREARTVVGHSVRQFYLNAGVTDLFLETGDQSLILAQEAQWNNAHERKMYISGAFGARHRDEAFGDDYELPSDRAYAETCATIADMYWTWRMILAESPEKYARYAETIEREIYNALAASIDETGTKFFYSNPLQLRPDKASEINAPRERLPWYRCACCPPNIARTVAQLSGFMASNDEETLWIHQIAPMVVTVPESLGQGCVRLDTNYPESGNVEISVEGTFEEGARLALRVPTFARDSIALSKGSLSDGYWVVPLTGGETASCSFPVSPRFVFPNPKVDALRGCAAVERGPVLYCVEDVDLPEGTDLDRLVLTGAQPREGEGRNLSVEVVQVPNRAELYGDADPNIEPSAPFEVPLVPFSSWGNRGGAAMRVWLPVL